MVNYLGEESVMTAAAGRITSSYRTEVHALDRALDVVEGKRPNSVVIFTDSQSALRSLQSSKPSGDRLLERVKKRLGVVALHSRVILQWVPGHVGVPGNERADEAANEGRDLPQEGVGIDFWTAKRAIQRAVHVSYIPDDRTRKVYSKDVDWGCTSRKEEVVMHQLRNGHCAKTEYYKHRVGLGELNTCTDCGEEEEKDHVWLCGKWSRKRAELGLPHNLIALKHELALSYIRDTKPEWLS